MVAGFGAAQFQLVLLRRMADHRPELVERALRRLEVSRADMREANRRWQSMIRSRTFPQGERRHRAVLGPPEAAVRRRIGDLDCQALLWPLPLWPELRFEVLLGPDGRMWNEWLVRAPGASAPVLRTREDLEPWTCTVDEVASAFRPAKPLEGDAPTRWRLACTDPASGERLVAHFTYGLLQYVEEAAR